MNSVHPCAPILPTDTPAENWPHRCKFHIHTGTQNTLNTGSRDMHLQKGTLRNDIKTHHPHTKPVYMCAAQVCHLLQPDSVAARGSRSLSLALSLSTFSLTSIIPDVLFACWAARECGGSLLPPDGCTRQSLYLNVKESAAVSVGVVHVCDCVCVCAVHECGNQAQPPNRTRLQCSSRTLSGWRDRECEAGCVFVCVFCAKQGCAGVGG